MTVEHRYTIDQLALTLRFTTKELQHLSQRTQAWHAARAFRLTASDAPLVCGNFSHKSVAEQRDEVLQRKVATVKALNRGEALPDGATARQQQAMAWGTEHERDGATAYAHAAARGLLSSKEMCSRQGLSLPSLGPVSPEVEMLCTALLQECGMQVWTPRCAPEFCAAGTCQFF